MKKMLAYVLTLAMTAGVLVGCTGKTVVIENPTENVETTENAEVAVTIPVTDAESDDVNVLPSNEPIVGSLIDHTISPTL